MSAELPSAKLVRSALSALGARAPTPPRSKTHTIVAFAAGTLAIASTSASIGCLFASLSIGIHPPADPVVMPLVIAGALVVLTIVAIVSLWRALEVTSRRAKPPEPLAARLDEDPRLVGPHERPALMAAILVGLVAAGSTKWRTGAAPAVEGEGRAEPSGRALVKRRGERHWSMLRSGRPDRIDESVLPEKAEVVFERMQ